MVAMDHAADFVCGWVAGCAGTLVSHPMDTIRVRLQTQGVVKNSVHNYGGMVDCFIDTVRREKVRGLFKGIVPPLLGTAAWNAVVFGTYGNVLRYLTNGRDDRMHDLRNIGIASLATSFTQSVVICPIELVKSRLQMQACEASTMYKGPLDCVRKIIKQQGVRGIFKGMKPTIIRDIPGFPSYFMSFELLCRALIPDGGTYTDLGISELMLAGGTAGTISWTLVFSPDVIKARIQLDYHNTYNGTVDCFVKSLRSEGLSLFTKGLAPTMLRGFTMNAAIFPVHILLLRRYHEDIRPTLHSHTHKLN